jgi:hypothetical protein
MSRRAQEIDLIGIREVYDCDGYLVVPNQSNLIAFGQRTVASSLYEPPQLGLAAGHVLQSQRVVNVDNPLFVAVIGGVETDARVWTHNLIQ